MRPVRLEMNGFASFRTATTVDFTDADYFALVGPTGSGKSTVIDAMVFALFGSAPRWGRSNAIQYALAPTGTRATVRLVFDVGPARYQIAREVRRYGQQIQQKAASLERFDNPGNASATTDEVVVLASDVGAVTPAVEALLGLSFEDFTKAVVLPQGRFAEFLNARPAERQTILLKLLGAHQYDLVMQAAGRRQSAAEKELIALDATLAELEDATPEAEAAAESRVNELKELQHQVAELLGSLGDERAAATQAQAVVEAVQKDVLVLAAVQVPSGVDQLQERTDTAHAELGRAREAEAAAAAAYAEARAALDASDNRTQLELQRSAWSELAGLRMNLPTLEDAHGLAQQTLTGATEVLSAAEAAWSEAVPAETAAKQTRDQASARVSDLETRRDAVATITPPGGIDDLAQRLDDAAKRLAEAAAAVQAAETADEAAQAAREEAGDDLSVREKLGQLDRLERLQARLQELQNSSQRTLADRDKAQQDAATASAAVEELRVDLETASLRVSAAELRVHLALGDDCPVCTQTVAVLPEPIDLGAAADLSAHLKAAERSKKAADDALLQADRSAARASDAVATSEAETAELLSGLREGDEELDAVAMRARLNATGEKIAAAKHAANSARQALAAARRARTAAEQPVTALEEERKSAWKTLREVQDGVLAFGAQTAGTESIQEAWRELAAWAASQLADLDQDQLPSARAHAEASLREHENAAARLRERAAKRTEATKALEAATQQEARASASLVQASTRSERLTEELASVPTSDEIATKLQVLDEREAAEKSALAAHRNASRAREAAEHLERELLSEVQGAAELLRSTRDPLVPLGAPALDERDLPAAWVALTEWAQQGRTAAETSLARAVKVQQLAATSVAATEQALVEAAASHGVTVTSAATVEASVATAAGRAEDRLTDIQSDRARRTGFELKRKAVAERAGVAALLADSLNARKFQKWLAGAALDLLVDAASDSLFELSGRQFGLAHDNGEFFVIDHTDAEARRSVRTLSGGETFQASLALALALSAELSSLSSSAASLDSIFLDEGFGSLDVDSLETVALTLERLAQSDRMVGVVTHVQGLAERVPTRYVVSRNSRTSSITREG